MREFLEDADVLRLEAFATLGDVELDLLTLVEALVAAPLDVRVVDEDILVPACGGDEAEPFFAVEKLDCSGCHDVKALLSIFVCLLCSLQRSCELLASASAFCTARHRVTLHRSRHRRGIARRRTIRWRGDGACPRRAPRRAARREARR